jgi:hypothetical protein
MNSLYDRQPGDLIAHYRVQRWLGAGAEGSVYLCRDVHDGALRTVKVLRGRNMLDEAQHTVAAYRRLGSVTSVKRLVDWGVLKGQRGVGERPWLAFHFIRGEVLSDRIEEGRIRKPLAVLRAVCDALAPVHRRGMAIGDFDNERNILTVDRGTKLVRFCDLDAGTPGYAPPTQDDDIEELLRLARRLDRCFARSIGVRRIRQLAEARSLSEAQAVLRGPE